jgi:hypothetical protein
MAAEHARSWNGICDGDLSSPNAGRAERIKTG